MAYLDRDAARHHGPRTAATGQPAAGPFDPQPLPLSRSAQPRAGRIAERASRAEPGRAGAARDSADDQRHFGRIAEYGVVGRVANRRRAAADYSLLTIRYSLMFTALVRP